MRLNDRDAHRHAVSIPMKQVVQELVDLLGLTMVAAIGGVTETRAVARWLVDREPQRSQALRLALQLATMIASTTDEDVVRAWFQASNPHLHDRSPIIALRHSPLEDYHAELMAAARAFVEPLQSGSDFTQNSTHGEATSNRVN